MRCCVVSFVEPAPHEFGADAWPLHVTWVPPFDVADDDTLATGLDLVIAGRPVVSTTAVSGEWFGARRHVRVTELARTEDVLALHEAILAVLAESGVDVARMRHVRGDFRPHVTVQQGRGLSVGEPVRLGSVALVAMRPDGDSRRRRLLRTWRLV